MSESETQQDVQQKVTRAFRDNVLRWVEIDDDIRSIRAKVKELNDEKKQFEEQIISYLTKVDEESIIIKDGKLSKSVSKSQAPLKKETIHKSLVELVGDSTKAMAMTEHIINSRETTQKIRLSRTKTREGKSKKKN
jgi:hypothetical protein